MVMKALVLFSLTQCLTAVFLGYQGEVEWLGGRRGGLGMGCQGDRCLPKGDVEACETAVKDPTRALCFASGGLNPNIEGDKHHYTEPAWINFPRGGEQEPKLLDFHGQLTAQDCMYCPAVGYWPEAETSAMLACKKPKEEPDPLLLHCVYTGVLLSQDAVLYRPSGSGVRMYKTYMLGKPWKENLLKGVLDVGELMQGAFGDSNFEDITAESTKFGTVFDCDAPARQFCFELDDPAKHLFCKNLCRTVRTTNGVKCAAVSEGFVRGRPCDVTCMMPAEKTDETVVRPCVPKKTGCDLPKCFDFKTEKRRTAWDELSHEKKENEALAKVMKSAKSGIEKKLKAKANARARARSLGRRLLRWLRGRARLAQ